MTQYRTEIAQDENGCWQAFVYDGDDPEPVYVSLPCGGSDGKRRAAEWGKWFVQQGEVKQPKLF